MNGAAKIHDTQPRTKLLHARAHPRVKVDEQLSPGTRVGSYELIRLIGRGGMGEVHLARDTRLGRRVAIKFVCSPSPGFAARFDREARATARCHHENIVVIHEIGRHGDLPFMVLEYIVGETLRARHQRGIVPYREALGIGLAIVRALAHAHALGIVHRDLKPDNVMIANSGVVKVLDFGVAKAWAMGEGGLAPNPRDSVNDNNNATALTEATPIATQEGDLIGTLPYMAPEQTLGSKVDARTDIWGVGIVLYQLIAGRHPLDLDLEAETLRQRIAHPDRPMPSLTEAAPQLPAEVAALVQSCLQKNPDQRYQSADELAVALERLLKPTSRQRPGQTECPYPGLLPFSEEDIDRFFGREADTRRALTAIEARPITALIGPSGAGKSSFVRAGLVPSLKQLGCWDAHYLRPGRAPLESLVRLCEELLGRSFSPNTLAREPGIFGAALRERARHDQRLLLVVDPFEELYVQTGSDSAARTAFLRCLIAAADDESSPIRVLLCMRADFVHRTSEDPALTETLGGGLLFLAPLARHDMVEALKRPAELVGYRFEEGLAETMAAALALTSSALPLLQFTAAALWRDREREGRLLTLEAYDKLGGVGGALATHADHVLSSLPSSARDGARRLLLKLVTPDRTRAIVDRAELLDNDQEQTLAPLLDRLTESRLLVVNVDSGAATVEIAHESLISTWPVLARWVEAEQEWLAFHDELRRAARDWHQRGRPRGALWTGEVAKDVYRWHARIAEGDVSAREQAFANEVIALDQRALFARRRLQLAIAGVITLLAVGVAVALGLINRSERQAAKAARKAATNAQRALAEHEGRRRAEAQAQQAQKKVKLGERQLRSVNAELAQTNRNLAKKAAAARAAQLRAEAEGQRAKSAEQAVRQQKKALQQQKEALQRQKQTLERQKRELERLLAERNARVRALKRRLRGISTQLKQ